MHHKTAGKKAQTNLCHS